MKIRHVNLLLFLLSTSTLVLVIYRLFYDPVTEKDVDYSKVQKQSFTTESSHEVKQCSVGYVFSKVYNRCELCTNGTFSLYGWVACQPQLDCRDIAKDVRLEHLLSISHANHIVKLVYLANWYGYKVIHLKCSHHMFHEDCLNNIQMLQAFQISPLVVQIIGACLETTEVVTTYYQYGSADGLNNILPSIKNMTPHRELLIRLQLSEDYLNILSFLHNSPIGVRVMCDTNNLLKTLSQFLITDNFRLVVNDLDALPEVDRNNGRLVICGRREIGGELVAPEQLWPYPGEPYNQTKMPGYDEKIDIWRIPAIITWFLGNSPQGLQIKDKLKNIFSLCQSNNPVSRPTAQQVLKHFQDIKNTIVYN